MEKTSQFSVQIFGDYVLLDRIAVGGMAEIFKAKQSGPRGFERILVIKRILQHLSNEVEFKQMFDDEARIAAQLRHANIVQIFELGDIDGTPYIAMEFVEGRNLRDLTRALQAKGMQLSVEQTLFIISETLRGLHYAHHRSDSSGKALEIIHRDMSPQNIILSYEGEVKILDFGIAKAASRISKTEAGVLKGKFSYMSPEQASGRPITQSTDIYAVGVILHELLTGERLFRAETDIETIERVKIGIVPKPSDRNPQIPPELDAIVLKCLQRNPEKRYQTAGEMQADISRLMREKNLVYGPQELSAFMKTLFADFIKEDRERLRSALERAPEAPSKSARTHIAFKADTAIQKDKTRVSNPSQKGRGFFVLLLTLFVVSMAVYVYVQDFANAPSKPTAPDARPINPSVFKAPQDAKPTITNTEPEPKPEAKPEEPQPKVEEILTVDKPKVDTPPEVKPETKPTEARPRQRPAPRRIIIKGTGTLDVLPPPDGFAELFINNQSYGYVPGSRATNIRLSAGKHQIRCESGSRTYSGEITIEADQKKRINCAQLK